MKIYRVHMTGTSNGSHGFEYFTSKADAMRAAREWIRQSDDENGGLEARVEIIIMRPTRTAILALLNRYASHPDNG